MDVAAEQLRVAVRELGAITGKVSPFFRVKGDSKDRGSGTIALLFVLCSWQTQFALTDLQKALELPRSLRAWSTLRLSRADGAAASLSFYRF